MRFEGDGVTTRVPLTFDLRKGDGLAVDFGEGLVTEGYIVDFEVTPTVVIFKEPLPKGKTVTIRRLVYIGKVKHVFQWTGNAQGGADFSALNLDENFEQIVRASQDAMDAQMLATETLEEMAGIKDAAIEAQKDSKQYAEDAKESAQSIGDAEDRVKEQAVKAEDAASSSKHSAEEAEKWAKEAEDVVGFDITEYRKLDDNVFNGCLQVRSEHEGQGTGVFLQGTDGAVRGQVVATEQGLQLTQYPKDGGLQTFTLPYSSGEVALTKYLESNVIGLEDGTDITKELNEAIANMKDGDKLYLPSGRYRVSKDHTLSDFPNNDQPCILIRDKKNVVIEGNGAVLYVEEHGQGLLEIQSSENVIIRGLTIEGCKEFPLLDGNSGRGEKGTSTDGYHTTGFWGYYKNNAYDTAKNTGGGYGKQFPQEGGSTSNTWGKWKGGFIGNASFGVLLHNGCNNVTVEGVKVSGFNYAGIGIGFMGNYFPQNLNYTISKNIKILNCMITDNYSVGINFSGCENVIARGNTISRIGHPDAKPSENTYSDPGYGTASTNSGGHANYVDIASDVVITENHITDCVRKGIDMHSGYNFTVKNNTITNAGACGIYFNWSSPGQPATGAIIDGNVLRNCGYGNNTLGGIRFSGCIDSNYSYDNIKMDTIVVNNRVYNSTWRGISSNVGRNIHIANNYIEMVGIERHSFCIEVGRSNDKSYNVVLKDNIISTEGSNIGHLIRVTNTEGGYVSGNMLYDRDNTSDNVQRLNIVYSDVLVNNNIVNGDRRNPDKGTLNIVVSQSNFPNADNFTLGADYRGDYLLGSNKDHLSSAKLIGLKLVVAEGVIKFTPMSGKSFIDDVVSTATGFMVKLKNLPETTMDVLPSLQGLGSTGIVTPGGSTLTPYCREFNTGAVHWGLKTNNLQGSHVPLKDVSNMSVLISINII